jgi:hypothetical protein
MQGLRVKDCVDQAALVTPDYWPILVPENRNFTNTVSGKTFWQTNMSTSRIFIVGFPGLQVDRTDHSIDGDKKYAAPESLE